MRACSCRDLEPSVGFVHLLYYVDSLVSRPNTEHMLVLCFRRSLYLMNFLKIILSAAGVALATVAHRLLKK